MLKKPSAERSLQHLLKMHKLTNAFRAVRRTTKVVGESRLESDPEHVYQLAMLAWYIIDIDRLQLDRQRVFEYCLAHDLPEAYAGDVDPWTSTEDQKRRKEQREAEAEMQLAAEFREFEELSACLGRYHAQGDEESRFVYALDKIQPVINIYLDGGDFYRARRVTLSAWITHNETKVAKSEHIVPYFEAIKALLKAPGTDLFYKP